MSKTLAGEIAGRTLEVTNPMNRALAMRAALQRHGFDPNIAELPRELAYRPLVIAWLLSTYTAKE